MLFYDGLKLIVVFQSHLDSFHYNNLQSDVLNLVHLMAIKSLLPLLLVCFQRVSAQKSLSPGFQHSFFQFEEVYGLTENVIETVAFVI